MRQIAFILSISLIVHVGLLVLLPGDGLWVEAVYADRIYPAIAPIIAFVPSRTPFSVASVLLATAILWILAYLAVNLRRWRRGHLGLWQAGGRTLAGCVILATLVFHAFFLSWGYLYLRPSLEQRLGLDGVEPTREARLETAKLMVQRAVAARVPVDDWDPGELDALVDKAIGDALEALEGRRPTFSSPLKGALPRGLLAKFGTRGVISPLTLEAHVDFKLPPAWLAFTAAHEKAHLAGFARERDASFVAWYALSRSADPRLRYAGYLGVIGQFLNADPEIRAMAEPLVEDLRALTKYYNRTVSPLLNAQSERIYDVYLKANRVSAGLADYRQVAQLIEVWRAKRGAL